MMENFRFGILGTGKIAQTFFDAVQNVEGAEVSAAASRTPGKAWAFAQKNNIPDAYEDYESLLSRSDIDAVYIATTHNFHYENMVEALQYGKPVLCEKAFTLTKDQAEKVFTLAKEKKLFCMEAMWSRFLPAIRKAREWVQSGKLGRIDGANLVIGFKGDPDPKGRILNPDLAGGAMYDIGVYGIELMTYLIPEKLVRVQSEITYAETGVDKMDQIVLRFENCIASIQTIISCAAHGMLNIYGTEGRIYIQDPHVADHCQLFDGKGLKEDFYSRRENGFEYQIQEVMDCVRGGRLESETIPQADTIQCAEIFDLCLGTK